MSNIVFIATSIDGYIAKENGSIDWLNEFAENGSSDFGYSQLISRVDAIVMGRNTYEKVLELTNEWPYSKKVFVLSNSLKEPKKELADKVEVVSGELKDILSNIKSSGFENLYIDGGQVIQQFLREYLIDELILTRMPILLGGGISLFGDLKESIKPEHCSTEVHSCGIIQTRYFIK